MASCQNVSVGIDCRGFDQPAYQEYIAQERASRFSTVFATTFLNSSDHASNHVVLAAAYSSGCIKLFSVRDAKGSWLGRKESAQPCLSWQAHQGAVYALTVVGQGPSAVLISGGDDGVLRGWKVEELLQLSSSSSSSSSGKSAAAAGGKPQEVLVMRLPQGGSMWGGLSLPPAVCSISYDGQRGQLYAGCSDGGVHAFDPAAPSPTAPTASLQGHVAGVLCTDYCSTSSLLASGSEDGTVRVWDVRVVGGAAPASGSGSSSCSSGAAAGSSRGCVNVISMEDGADVGAAAAAPLRCARAPHASAIRWEPGGDWLVCGTGGNTLLYWSQGMGALATKASVPCTPQALHMVPGEILLLGSQPTLYRYTFTGALTSQHAVGAKSGYALDVCGSGSMIAAGGTNGCIDLLSMYGTRVGAVFGEADEE